MSAIDATWAYVTSPGVAFAGAVAFTVFSWGLAAAVHHRLHRITRRPGRQVPNQPRTVVYATATVCRAIAPVSPATPPDGWLVLTSDDTTAVTR